MTRHFERALDKLKKQLLALSATVEESLYRAVRSVKERNHSLAAEVIRADLEIDQREVDLEEECLKVLALNQPVAHDLRLTISIIKMNNELERIGDLAVNIAHRAQALSTYKPVDVPFDLDNMASRVKLMLRRSLDALINLDTLAAQEVLATDSDVDAMNRQAFSETERRIAANPEETKTLICVLGVSRALERIADHATNIAEDVIYLVSGDIVRHRDSRKASGMIGQ